MSEKRHRTSARWQDWDYRWSAAYFITICTHDKEHFLGKIVDGKMKLSPQGLLADVFWHETKNHAKNIELGAFVVMPNHIHGILILNEVPVDDRIVGTGHTLSLQSQQPDKTIGQQRLRNPGKNSVSSIIGSYKSAVAKHANRLKLPFAWQMRFHDHVIRDGREYEQIENYIINNPVNWKDDRFYV